MLKNVIILKQQRVEITFLGTENNIISSLKIDSSGICKIWLWKNR